jgi:hypothetical protein
VVFERSRADYLAYAAASRSWPRPDSARFLETFVPRVRRAMARLELVVLLPVSRDGPEAGPDENPRYRRRVDAALQAVLLDDEHGLLDAPRGPRVAALAGPLARRLAELLRLTRPPAA